MESSVQALPITQAIYSEAKFWIPVIGGLWSVFKGFSWVKAIRTNDLHHIQLGVNDLKTGLDNQTQSIVGELKELRNDFRSFYPVRARAAKAGKPSRRKK